MTAISEKKSLSTMTSASLFGKLQEHELELGRLEKHESQEKKSKGIALKIDTRDDKDNETSEDENFMLLVKKLGKFFNNNKSSSFSKKNRHFRKKDASTSNQEVTCYECGKQGHIKPDCPKLAKKGGFKGKKDFKNKKAYVAWDDKEISSSSKSESDECANMDLMASYHSDEEIDEVSSSFSIYDNEAQEVIDELLKECKTLCKNISSQKKIISFLEEQNTAFIKNIENEKQKLMDEKQSLVCKNCESLSFQIVQLKRVLERYEKGQIGLEEILKHQRYSNDKSGLGYSKFSKPSINKTIFVKASEQVDKEKANNSQSMHQSHKKKRIMKKKNYVPRYRSHFQPTCFYCGIKGHTPNVYYVRNIGVAKRHYVWVEKGNNYQGPKEIWVPNNT